MNYVYYPNTIVFNLHGCINELKVDLHSNNNYVGIMDKEGKRLYKKKLPNDMSVITSVFQPYREPQRVGHRAMRSEIPNNWTRHGTEDFLGYQ